MIPQWYLGAYNLYLALILPLMYEEYRARPAEFLIDSGGVIRWVNLPEDYRVRARPEQMLQVIDALRAGSTPSN